MALMWNTDCLLWVCSMVLERVWGGYGVQYWESHWEPCWTQGGDRLRAARDMENFLYSHTMCEMCFLMLFAPPPRGQVQCRSGAPSLVCRSSGEPQPCLTWCRPTHKSEMLHPAQGTSSEQVECSWWLQTVVSNVPPGVEQVQIFFTWLQFLLFFLGGGGRISSF